MIKTKIATILLIFLIFTSCGIYRPANVKDVPINEGERRKKNIEEGKGLRLAAFGGERGGTFQFASANPLWRATLDVLDFAPLISANYSGGIIITDWVYLDNSNSDDSYKITVKFLTNEIRSDALEITLHQKNCNTDNACSISKIKNSTNEQISKKILKIAALYEKDDQERLKEELGEYQLSRPKKN